MPSYPIDRKPMRTFPKTIDAHDYNRVRLALHRLSNPLRLSLLNHRGLEAVLTDETWLVVDSLQADEPILAWAKFKRPHDALHENVTCELYLYHTHSGLIMGTALEDILSALNTPA